MFCSRQQLSSSGDSVSKKSFLSNLETKVYRHVALIKPNRQVQRPPQSMSVTTAPPAPKVHSNALSKGGASASAGDVSISDEAFLDFDIDGEWSGVTLMLVNFLLTTVVYNGSKHHAYIKLLCVVCLCVCVSVCQQS
jgi:hypothetical protein